MAFQPHPLAYHIVWTTYGTWLHGDWRGSVRKGVPGVQPPDPRKREAAKQRMTGRPVVLTEEQIQLVEAVIEETCRENGWTLLAVKVKRTHIHAVVSSPLDSGLVRSRLKARCTKRLSDQAGLTRVKDGNGRMRWFTEGGDEEWIWSEEYLREAIAYVMERQ